MFIRSCGSRPGLRSTALAMLAPALVVAAGQAQTAPALQRSAVSLGQQLPSVPVAGTVWLQLHNKAALDAAVKAMYTPGSPTYRKFGNTAMLQQFAPTAAEMTAVKKQLAAHNLAIVSTDPNNLSVRIEGQTSDFEAAFHTTVQQYRTAKGAMVATLGAAPTLSGSAAGMVKAVTGLSNQPMQPFFRVPVDPSTGKQIGVISVAAAQKSQGAYYSSNCFYNPQPVALTTPNQPYPDADYFGIQYGAPPSNTTPGTISPCGYSPQDFYKLFGLTTAYNQGFTGTGQTVAIVDAYGSPTIQADLAEFNQLYNLPAATSANFQVVQTSPFTATNAGWAGETSLDVEWSHAVAPNARILLVTTPTAYDSDLQAGVMYVIENHLANVISNSYGQGELEESVQSITTWDEICELASFEGISVNFATGDDGDYYAAEKLNSVDVSVPADSPYATAVGGTSAVFSPAGGGLLQTGWGTGATQLGTAAGVDDPPVPFGFQGGSGGGVSQVFAKPAYQSALTGSGRELPDVSALADPYTGVEIILTQTVNGVTGQYIEAIGGTSLATPVFSAEWALLDQALGQPLGQAAPLVAQFATSGAVSDVLPPPDQYSAYGAILDANGIKTYSATALGMPETASGFLGTLYNDGGGDEYDLTFATDSSLPVTQGWDPVTGWGTLNLPTIFTSGGSLKAALLP